jgi:hypothetical protein
VRGIFRSHVSAGSRCVYLLCMRRPHTPFRSRGRAKKKRVNDCTRGPGWRAVAAGVPRCGPPGGGCWRPGANAGGARGVCARPCGANGRVCAGLAELVGTLGCACACVHPWAACVRGMRMHRRAHALYARGYAHARRACGRVCRVLVRYVCAQVRPVPLGANKRTMPASRAVKPGCCKNLGRGFPEVLPKTALCAGYLS